MTPPTPTVADTGLSVLPGAAEYVDRGWGELVCRGVGETVGVALEVGEALGVGDAAGEGVVVTVGSTHPRGEVHVGVGSAVESWVEVA
ncbi:MAG: hypothetical protein M3P04_09900, partial [Actinomycetota bacterium]|nr:hypothetical protein [Actinomycetota bacterium]